MDNILRLQAVQQAEAMLEQSRFDDAVRLIAPVFQDGSIVAGVIYVRALMGRAAKRDASGDLLNAQKDYELAEEICPPGDLRREVIIALADIRSRKVEEHTFTFNEICCPYCGQPVQDDWINCPHCSSNLRNIEVQPEPVQTVVETPISQSLHSSPAQTTSILPKVVPFWIRRKKMLLGAAASVIIFVVVILVTAPERLYLSALDDYNKGSYAAAVQKYEAYLRKHPNASRAEKVKELLPDTLLTWEKGLRKARQYEAAANKLIAIIDLYPNSAAAKSAKSELNSNFTEWIGFIKNNVDFQHLNDYMVSMSSGNRSNLPSTSFINQIYPELYFAWGKALSEQQSYPDANNKFKYLVEKYPNSEEARSASEAIVKNLFATEDYSQAVDVMENARSFIPAADWKQTFGEIEYSAFNLWTQSTYRKSKPAEAAAVLEKARNISNDAEWQDKVRELTLNFYQQWVDKLILLKNYQNALDKAEEIFSTYSLPSWKSDIQIMKQGIYTKWIDELYIKRKYKEGLSVIKEAGIAVPDYDWSVKLHWRANQMEEALSKDVGPEGQAVLQEAMADLCENRPTDITIIGNLPGSGKARVCSETNDFTLASALTASNPGELKYYIKVDRNQTTIQTCPYNGGYYVERRTTDFVVNVYSVVDMKNIGNQTFYGGTPGECGYFENFIVGQYYNYHDGDAPTSEEINTWLASVMN